MPLTLRNCVVVHTAILLEQAAFVQRILIQSPLIRFLSMCLILQVCLTRAELKSCLILPPPEKQLSALGMEIIA